MIRVRRTRVSLTDFKNDHKPDFFLLNGNVS